MSLATQFVKNMLSNQHALAFVKCSSVGRPSDTQTRFATRTHDRRLQYAG